MSKFKFIVIILLTVIFSVPISVETFSSDNSEAFDEEATYIDMQQVRGKVTRQVEVIDSDYFETGDVMQTQIVEIVITSGEYKGEMFEVAYELNYAMHVKYRMPLLEVGDKIIASIVFNDKGEIVDVFIVEIARENSLIFLMVIFVIALLFFGGKTGFKALISLVLTVVSIIKILLPAIIKGYNPVLVTILMCIVLTTISLLIISGFNKKTISAIIGTSGGVIIAGVIAIIIGYLGKFSGYGSEDAIMLMNTYEAGFLDFKGILFSGIIIGTMGATMDVGMSIASAMHEVKENSPDITTKQLIKSGMNVGQDAMATMANTLILAYAGSSLLVMLLFYVGNVSMGTLINWEMIASEILRSMAGSIGIIFSVPITVISTVFVDKLFKKNSNNI